MSAILERSSGSVRRVAVGIAIFGFVVRLGLAIALGLNDEPENGSDSQLYDTYAWNVAKGRGYRGMSPDVEDQDHLSACVVPGTPVVWAGLYAIFGHRYDVIRVAHCVFGAIAVFLVFEIGNRCYGPRVGLFSAALYSVFPTALINVVSLMSEALGNLWFLSFILATLWFGEKPSWARSSLAGLFLGATMLTRASCIFMFPLVVVWGVWQFRDRWSAAIKSVAIPIVAIATIAPWAYRNYLVFHEFIPLSTLGGSGLLQGNNDIVVTDPNYFGYCIWDTDIPEYREALQTAGDEVERDRRARRFAVEWLKKNPDKWWFLVRHKFWRALTPFLQPHTPKMYRLGMLLAWGPVLLLFGMAYFPTLIAALRRKEPQWLLHLAILQYLMTSVIFFGMARYRQQVEPLCIVLAMQALTSVIPWRSGAVRLLTR